MREEYMKLMIQQSLSEDANTAFYKKLEQVQPKKRLSPMLRAAVIVVCIGLLVPVSVWAMESIFGVVKATQTQRPTYYDRLGTGLDVVYENLKDYSIEDFSEHLQKLNDYEEAVHESWNAAEKYLGIDLVDNIHFTADDTYRKSVFGERGKNAASTCWTYDDQLFASRVIAAFERAQTSFWVRATVSVDVPAEIKEDVYNYYHGYSITYHDAKNIQVETQHYVTQAGIPVLIVTVISEENLKDIYKNNDWQNLIECCAFFSVNNVSYSVLADCKSFGTGDLDRYENPKEKVMPALLEFLDGFVIE